MTARCPRCGGTDIEPCDVVREASDRSEDVRCNLRCKNPRCREPFRHEDGEADPWRPPYVNLPAKET